MILTHVIYDQFKDTPREWEISCNFKKINLIVGKNASGKTRTLNIIGNIAKQIADGKQTPFESGDYELHFLKGKRKIKYFIKYNDNKIVHEKLMLGNKIFLKRNADGTGEIISEQFKEKMKFRIEDQQMAISLKRDSFQHPFMEDINIWAEQLVHFHFGSDFGKKNAVFFIKTKNRKSKINIKDTDKIIVLYRHGLDTLGENFAKIVLQDIQSIDFPIENISIEKATNIKVAGNFPISVSDHQYCLSVKEKKLENLVNQFSMSQGMYRAIALIIYINYLSMTDQVSPILIDDIGEGLDYERSSLLVNLLIKKAKLLNFQLIMTSNDRFVMNSVALEYWQIIQRIGSSIKFYNSDNSSKIFRKFELTGLSNFDMFSSKYFLRDPDAKNSNNN